jgi:hypothetical protein
MGMMLLIIGDARIWFYQTCSEFAFYQTCDPGSNCPFTQGLNDLASNTNLCRIAYGITPDQIQKRVDWSNTFWGAGKPAGRRLMYVNGEVDPVCVFHIIIPFVYRICLLPWISLLILPALTLSIL